MRLAADMAALSATSALLAPAARGAARNTRGATAACAQPAAARSGCAAAPRAQLRGAAGALLAARGVANAPVAASGRRNGVARRFALVHASATTAAVAAPVRAAMRAPWH